MAGKRPTPTGQGEPKKPVPKPKSAKEDAADKLIAENRKARHDYHIDETLEAGLMLRGTEVKSLRDGRVVLQDSFAQVMKDEMWLMQADIQVYTHGSVHNHEPRRMRKLLAHRREIERWASKVKEKGYTIIPLKMYWKNGRAKVLLGLARGKKEFDRRDDIKQREGDREANRALRRGRR